MVKLTPAREAVLAGVMVALLHSMVRLTVAPGAFQDDAIYLGLGRALATGEGWRSIYTPGAPIHLKYPPGLPAVYALLWMAGESLATVLRLVQALQVIVAGVCGGLAWWIVRDRLHLGAGAAGAALAPFSLVSLLDYFQLPIAEGPFVAAWLGALAIGLGTLTPRRAVALGLVLAATTLLRTQGIVVTVGVVAGMLLARREPRLVLIAGLVAVVPVVAWWIYHAALVAAGPVSTQPDEAAYATWLGAEAVLRGFLRNVRTYWSMIPRELGPAGWGHFLLLVAAGLAGLGAVRGGRRLLPVTLSAGLSVLLILAWPYSQSRLVLALFPVGALLVVRGWPAVAARLPRRGALALAIALVALPGAWQVAIRSAAHVDDAVAAVGFQPIGRTLTANTAWMVAVSPWVLGETAPGARLLTEGAAGLWLVTRRVGVTAVPAVPNVGAPTSGHPAGYFAERIVADSITVVIASSAPVLAGLARVEQRCPGTLLGGLPIEGVATAWAVSDSGRRCLAGF